MSVISQSSEKSRIAAITSITTIISQIKDQMNDLLKKVIFLGDWCSLQFPSSFIIALATHHENLSLSGIIWRLSTGSVPWMVLVEL